MLDGLEDGDEVFGGVVNLKGRFWPYNDGPVFIEMLLEDGTAIVSWLERRGEGQGEVLVRRVSPGRAPGPPVGIAKTVSGRATGVPHLVRIGDRMLVAWRNERVLTAAVPIASILP